MKVRHLWFLSAMMLAASACAGDLEFSDPANVADPPPYAIGFPSRDAGLDALPGFRSPPPGYGEVAFYWWLGDPLTKERLQWQIEQLSGKGVMGLQVNYAHSNKGGRSYGLTYPSDPPLFSEKWWALYGWFVKEARQHGMAASLSDYTLGIGQGWYCDEVIHENPDLRGAVLRHTRQEFDGGREIAWEAPENALAVTAYRLKDGKVEAGSAVDLRPHLSGRAVRWQAPAGRWLVAAVAYSVAPYSMDPMNPKTGAKVIEKFFQRFEDRNPGEGGKGLNFFFSDELGFGVSGNLWTPRFAEEFRARKGYDLLPELPALYVDIGPRTPKVRLDYRDVMVAMTEAGFFRPVFDWHQKRGMIYGCDHGGRGTNVVEFGDYFRTQRWNQGPGCDQPHLSRNIIKNKVASSIAHLYLRPRTWIEGYHSSGWGTTSAQVADATFANFAMGQNLLTLHGLYYSTHGGWWEWAPPCNHFRMPYWAHMGELLNCVQRLSYLLSQGYHRCDVAVLYPVAPMEADMGGADAVKAAFAAGSQLYGQGIDFDFMDFESLARTQVKDKQLQVSGEAYRVLVLPAMRAVRFSTVQKALEFWRAGGVVVAIGALPEASDRAGRNDAQLDALVKEIFGFGAAEAASAGPRKENRNAAGGLGLWLARPEQTVDEVAQAVPRDFTPPASVKTAPPFMHRKVGPRDVYMVYGAAKGAEYAFRAAGKVEWWDPWTGETHPLPVVAQTPENTRLRMPLTEKEAQVIVFSPGAAAVEKPGAAEAGPVTTVAVEGDWEFELKPSLDNRWGDYRWPPSQGFIGAEARRFRYADETRPDVPWQDPRLDDSKWSKTTCSFGPRFWKLGPLPETAGTAALEAQLAALRQIDPSVPVELGGRKYTWQPYAFSWRYGVENDPGPQGYHGLKEEVSDDFLALGRLKMSSTGSSYEQEAAGSRHFLWTSVAAPRDAQVQTQAGGIKPAAVWLNGKRLDKPSGEVSLRAGPNPLLLRYDKPGRTFFVVGAGKAAEADDDSVAFSPAAFWIWRPDERGTADRFFRKAFQVQDLPAKAYLRITCDNAYKVYLNGQEIGRGNSWQHVQQYEVAGKLKRGVNLIAAAAHNDGADAGLIAELILASAKASPPPLATDATWRVAKAEENGWLDAAFDDSRWLKAQPLSDFRGSLWAKHPQGPPVLDAPAAAADEGRPVFKISPLAMTWYRAAGLMPLDTRPDAAQPAGWYRFTSPPGLRSMTVIARGKVRAWADGAEMKIGAPKPRDDGSLEYRATVAKLAAARPVLVAIRIEQDRGSYAGAALPEPIALDCAPGVIAPGDWSRIDGLAGYSGGAWYRKTVTLTPRQIQGRTVLDLGEVISSAEVRVNGQPAGIRVAPPWTVDVSKLVKAGENRIEVLVYNALANHYSTIPTRYRGSAVSGLLGPVVLQLNAKTEPRAPSAGGGDRPARAF